MRINVTFRHMEATDALREHAEKRVRRVAKYVHRPVDAHVILSVVKRRHIAEVVFKADRAVRIIQRSPLRKHIANGGIDRAGQ